MEELKEILIPALALAALTAGWMGVQIIAKRMQTKNHIDQTSGCCGACSNKGSCERKTAH
ncbi:MAG: hypothetical protein LPK80_11200 [Bacteroidota bacterium]|nr:hypothetical protein [Bacteroidota bacterium]MDX5404776.1 hypothetical protein [Bacteroidota bacterium]MDX5428011.1 hypothetical protein [Bacteroidota bacterium]MDX5448146.1 hypothetical protein [Bacteroidota bacterium]MDX5505852.1 hypothetical protein [Bacteroidota bacterium]